MPLVLMGLPDRELSEKLDVLVESRLRSPLIDVSDLEVNRVRVKLVL